MAAVFAVDELTGDANARSGLADATLQHESDPELLRRLLHPDWLALVSEHGVAGDNVEAGDFRQVRNDVFGDAV